MAILSVRRNGVSHFYHHDGLGSTVQLTDANQNVTDSYVYRAFGEEQAVTGTTPNPLRFVGNQNYHTDVQSGLKLLGRRYYDKNTARFVTIDPRRHSTSWYRYANNSPVTMNDPSGTQPVSSVVILPAGDCWAHAASYAEACAKEKDMFACAQAAVSASICFDLSTGKCGKWWKCMNKCLFKLWDSKTGCWSKRPFSNLFDAEKCEHASRKLCMGPPCGSPSVADIKCKPCLMAGICAFQTIVGDKGPGTLPPGQCNIAKCACAVGGVPYLL